MSERLKQLITRYRITLLAGIASIIGVLGFAEPSYAFFSINDITTGLLAAAGGLIGEFVLWIVTLVNTVAAIALQIIAFLVDFGLRLNETVISEGIVPVGWKIARDVANLGFTVGLIAISFATILRMEQYGAKKLLGKLVIVALLINFSLLIPGVILDATNVFSHFFLSKITGGGGQLGLAALSTQLANSMEASGFANIKAGADNADTVENLASIIKIVVGGIFVIFFQVLAAIAMGGVAYMIFYRYLVLIFLFIVAPLAWISLFLPALGSLWEKWWKEFFKWALFLPFMTFFLYLTVLAASKDTFGTTINLAMTSYNSINDLIDIIPVAAQMAVIIGLIFGSLMVAQKFGIAGAGAAISVATGARKFMLGAITKGAVAPAKYLGTRPVKAGAMALANVLNKPALRWIPGAKGAVAGLNKFGLRKEEVEAYQKKYFSKDALPDEEFKKVLKGRLPEGPVARAALLAEAASRGMLGEIKDDPEKLLAAADAAKSANPGTAPKDIEGIQALLAVRPDLAEKVTDGAMTTYEATRKFVAADKMHLVAAEAWEDPGFVAGLSKKHWENLYTNPKVSREQLEAAEASTTRLAGEEYVNLLKQITEIEKELEFEKSIGRPQKDVVNKKTGEIITEGLETLRKKKLAPLKLDKLRLLNDPTSITAEDITRYDKIAKQRNTAEYLRRTLGRTPTPKEIALTVRGLAYEQYENNRQQMGNPFMAFWKKPGGGGPAGAPPGGPGPGGIPPPPPPTPPGGPTPLPPPAGGGPVPPPRVPPTPPGPAAPPPSGPTTIEELRTRAERAGGGTAPAGPTPPLPPAGSAPIRPTPQPRPSVAPTTDRYERTQAEEVEIASAVEELKKERAREAAKTPPRTVEEIRTRAEGAGGGTTPTGRPAPLPKERDTRATEEAERRAKAEEARAEAAKETAASTKEAAAAEEGRLKAAEKSAEAAAKGARAAEEELKAREAALGVTKETGKETGKILREVEAGAVAAKKAVQEFATLNLRGREDFTKAFTTDKIKELLGAEITTPDNKKRIVKSILRNNINPMQTTVITADDERIDLNQLFKYAEKSNAPIEVKKVKKT